MAVCINVDDPLLGRPQCGSGFLTISLMAVRGKLTLPLRDCTSALQPIDCKVKLLMLPHASCCKEAGE